MDSYYITINAIQILIAKSNGYYIMSWSNQNRAAKTKEDLANTLSTEFHITKLEATKYVDDLN
ncbi:hypothetical protein ACR9UB_003382 [Cronobacter dublinensis]